MAKNLFVQLQEAFNNVTAAHRQAKAAYASPALECYDEACEVTAAVEQVEAVFVKSVEKVVAAKGRSDNNSKVSDVYAGLSKKKKASADALMKALTPVLKK